MLKTSNDTLHHISTSYSKFPSVLIFKFKQTTWNTLSFFFSRTAFISSAYLSFKCLLTEERKEHTKTQPPSKKHFKMHLYFSRINLAL